MAKEVIKSVSQLNDERRNKKATYHDFPVGTAVKIVTVCRDFHFWYGETGTVIENKGVGAYLGITVKLDEPRTYEGNEFTHGEWKMTQFNFAPEDLKRRRVTSKLGAVKKLVRKLKKCLFCKGKGVV